MVDDHVPDRRSFLKQIAMGVGALASSGITAAPVPNPRRISFKNELISANTELKNSFDEIIDPVILKQHDIVQGRLAVVRAFSELIEAGNTAEVDHSYTLVSGTNKQDDRENIINIQVSQTTTSCKVDGETTDIKVPCFEIKEKQAGRKSFFQGAQDLNVRGAANLTIHFDDSNQVPVNVNVQKLNGTACIISKNLDNANIAACKHLTIKTTRDAFTGDNSYKFSNLGIDNADNEVEVEAAFFRSGTTGLMPSNDTDATLIFELTDSKGRTTAVADVSQELKAVRKALIKAPLRHVDQKLIDAVNDKIQQALELAAKNEKEGKFIKAADAGRGR